MASERHRQMTPSKATPRRTRPAFGVGVLMVLLLLPGLAAAAPDWRRSVQEQLEPSNLVDNPPGISLEQAANKVRRETGGRVLSASPADRGGKQGYEVRVLLDGKRVKSYFVDGQGRIRARD